MPAKAILSLNFEIYPFLIQSYRVQGDRAFSGLKNKLFKLLIIIGLAWLSLGSFAKSQISNDLVYNQLLEEYLSSKSSWKSVLGFRTPYVDSLLRVDTTQSITLNLADPEINYRRVQGGRYLRSLSVLVSSSDGEDQLLQRSDTLSSKEINESRRSVHPNLRGEHPSTLRRCLMPAGTILGGIAGIISLFYIRSR